MAKAIKGKEKRRQENKKNLQILIQWCNNDWMIVADMLNEKHCSVNAAENAAIKSLQANGEKLNTRYGQITIINKNPLLPSEAETPEEADEIISFKRYVYTKDRVRELTTKETAAVFHKQQANTEKYGTINIRKMTNKNNKKEETTMRNQYNVKIDLCNKEWQVVETRKLNSVKGALFDAQNRAKEILKQANAPITCADVAFYNIAKGNMPEYAYYFKEGDGIVRELTDEESVNVQHIQEYNFECYGTTNAAAIAKIKEEEEVEMTQKQENNKEVEIMEEQEQVVENKKLEQEIDQEKVQAAGDSAAEDTARAGTDPKKIDKLLNKFKTFFAQGLHTLGRFTGLSQLKDDIQKIVQKGENIDKIAADIRGRFFDEYEMADLKGNKEKVSILRTLLYNSDGELISVFELVLRFFKMANRAICNGLQKLYGFKADEKSGGFIGALLTALKVLVSAVTTAGGAVISVVGGVLSYIVAGVEYAVAMVWNVAVTVFDFVKKQWQKALDAVKQKKADKDAAVDSVTGTFENYKGEEDEE